MDSLPFLPEAKLIYRFCFGGSYFIGAREDSGVISANEVVINAHITCTYISLY